VVRTLALTSRQDLKDGLATAEHLCNSHLCLLSFLERKDRREGALREKPDLPLAACSPLRDHKPSHIVRSHPDPWPHLSQSALAGLGLGELQVE
jgi:hypothetical protein